MPITAGAAAAKIIELRSKLAVYDSFIELIRANYMTCDSGKPEVTITRDDGGNVSESHFAAVIEDIEATKQGLEEELQEWEGLIFEPKSAEVRELRPSTDDEEAAPAPVKKKGQIHGRRLQ